MGFKSEVIKMATIQDFGQKIGGAKKDLWKARGLMLEDLTEMNEAERDKYIKKNNIWPKPDYVKMVNEEGYSRDALYFIKTVRDSIPAAPQIGYADSPEQIQLKQEQYINFVNSMKNDLIGIKNDEDIKKIDLHYLVNKGYIEVKSRYSATVPKEAEAFMNNKVLKAVQMDHDMISREAAKKNFLSDEPGAIESIIRSKYKILDIDGNRVKVSDSPYRHSPTKTCIEEKVGPGSTRFYYANNTETNPNLLTPGRSIVVNGCNVEFAGDKDLCEGLLNELIEKVTGRVKAEKEAAKEAAKDIPEEEKEKVNRKTAFTPSGVDKVERTGPDERIWNVQGQSFIDDFNIRGGEFGNWVNDTERQINMNMAYDSFGDIAKALNTRDEDISLGGRLSIAFGARGSKGAAAHYEPMREVINLTRMNGAGHLGHEYFHSIDDIMGKAIGLKGMVSDFLETAKAADIINLKSKDTKTEKAVEAFQELIDKMKHTTTVDASVIQRRYKPFIEKYQEDCDVLTSNIKVYADRLLPDEKLNAGQIKRKEEIIQAMQTEVPFYDVMSRKWSSDQVAELSQLKKEVIGKAFVAKERNYFTDWQVALHDRKEKIADRQEAMEKDLKELKPVRVETQFYKDAQEMDKIFSKSAHGYWQSNCELAARAFACYLKDKLEDMGIKNDYLTGGAEQISPQGLVLFPNKEHRQELNKAFDKVIEAAKELGLFQDRAQVIEKIVQEPSHKDKQLEIILASNPMSDNYHVGIRDISDIKTFDEVVNDDESFCWGDFEKRDAEIALKTGEITVYSSKPIEQGSFVSTSYNQAKDYAGGGQVYSKKVPLKEVAWINGDEGQFAKVPEKSQVKEVSAKKKNRDLER